MNMRPRKVRSSVTGYRVKQNVAEIILNFTICLYKNLHKYFAVISTKILKFPLSGNFLPKSGHAGNKYRLD